MEIVKMEPGRYGARKDDVIVGYLEKQWQKASGNPRYVGYAEGRFAWEVWNIEDGEQGRVVATLPTFAEAKAAADRLLSH